MEPEPDTDIEADHETDPEAEHEKDVEAVHENEAFDSPMVHVLWLMPLGLFAFLTIAGLAMSLG